MPCGFRQEDFFTFPYIHVHVVYTKHATPGAAHFWPQENYLKKLGRDPLGDATSQIVKAQGLVVSDKKIFSCYSYIHLCKTCNPQGRPIFGPKDIN